MAFYSMNGVPAAAELMSAFYGLEGNSAVNSDSEQIVRLKIDAALKNSDGRYIAEMAQEGFSSIAITTGGKVYEY